jgi:hypothetical protein
MECTNAFAIPVMAVPRLIPATKHNAILVRAETLPADSH